MDPSFLSRKSISMTWTRHGAACRGGGTGGPTFTVISIRREAPLARRSEVHAIKQINAKDFDYGANDQGRSSANRSSARRGHAAGNRGRMPDGQGCGVAGSRHHLL